jgi:hypothetical protein
MDYTWSKKAPNVGPHERTTSLKGFDPLLMDDKKDKGKQIDPSSHSTRSLTPTRAEERDQEPSSPANGALQELRTELKSLATEIHKMSPQRVGNKTQKVEKVEKKKALKPPTTPQKSRRRLPGMTMTPPVSKHKKEISHRRTKSLDVEEQAAVVKNAIPPPPEYDDSPGSAMMRDLQEVWEVQQQQQPSMASADSALEKLALPSLAKPRPTSFLTGTEVVLTSEMDATAWQVELPAREEFEFTTRVSHFLDTYRKEECLLDLSSLVGCGRQDLAYFSSGQLSLSTEKIAKFHRPIVESLLECGRDLLQVQGYFKSKSKDSSPDGFREVLVVERQRQFLCTFRGTTSEQLGKVDRQPDALKLSDNGGVSVFADRYRAAAEFEHQLFALLDRLSEENPFCDFVFSGHGFGAAMATTAAYRYAWTRPELRVAVLASGSAKVGMNDFRLSAHSLGNLKVARLELGHVRPLTQTGFHIGHTIRINPSKSSAPVRAHRFADTKPDPSRIRKLRLNKDKPVADYVLALEGLGREWVKDFYRHDGAGVRGKDNESRYMV